MVSRGVQEHLAAAFLRELMDIEIEVEIHGMCRAEGIAANKGGRQGGTDTTMLWNYLLESAMEEVVLAWNQDGYGFQYENGPLVNHLIWADNIFIVASSVPQLQMMFRMLSRSIYKVKLQWKLEELAYITSSNVGSAGPL
eukprot:10484868-Karenia_brevis.AAC.1